MSDDNNNIDFLALQTALVDQLKAKKCLFTPQIEAAFRTVPRHLFLPNVPLDRVYQNDAIVTKYQGEMPISSSSQPSVMAIMLGQLNLEPGHHVLEIGAGTGFNAALMAQIVGDKGRVTTIDIDEDIVERARERLAAANFNNVQVICCDGRQGYLDAAPYDRIILTVGSDDVTPSWREQLKPNGQLLIPLTLSKKGYQKAIALRKERDYLVSTSMINVGFMNLRGAFSNPDDTLIPLCPEDGTMLCPLSDDSFPIAPGEVYALLTGANRDRSTMIQIAPRELDEKLALWLQLRRPRESGLFALIAEKPVTSHGSVPFLHKRWGTVYCTIGLFRPGSMALLARPPEQYPSLIESSDQSPFELHVRYFGEDDTLARHLIEQVNFWNDSGRPPKFETLRVRVYPKAVSYIPSANELVSERVWSNLVIDW
jgi:protein-L-isoaspartate(D-aspartate) O-methyltransferase